jgi:hypothetical protein
VAVLTVVASVKDIEARFRFRSLQSYLLATLCSVSSRLCFESSGEALGKGRHGKSENWDMDQRLPSKLGVRWINVKLGERFGG